MNTAAICELSKLLGMECSNMSQLSCDYESPGAYQEIIEDMMIDSITHIQALAIELTKQITGEARSDADSAFAEGELETVKGEDD